MIFNVRRMYFQIINLDIKIVDLRYEFFISGIWGQIPRSGFEEEARNPDSTLEKNLDPTLEKKRDYYNFFYNFGLLNNMFCIKCSI